MDTTTWKKVKLGDICTIKTGKLNANAAVENGEYPFFTCAEEVSRIDTYAFDTDAILISGNGSKLGHIHTYKGKFNAYQRTYVLDNFNINKEYLVQYLKANLQTRIKEYVKGGAVPYIVLECLSDMDILIPSLREQLQIANTLSTLDSLIEVKGGEVQNIMSMKAQLMSDIFSNGKERAPWPVVKLGDICKIYSGKGIKKSEYLEDGTYPIIGSNGEIGRCNQLNNKKPVLTTGRVGTIGTIQKVTNAWITDNTLIIDIINNDVDYNFMYYVLHTIDFDKITTGNAQPLVTSGRLKEVIIQIPPFEEQKRIAKILSDYDDLIKANDEKSEVLRKQKTQMMNSIFTERESLQWRTVKYEDIFDNIVDKGYTDLEFLTIVQGKGTVYRDESDRKLQYDKSKIRSYKHVSIGDTIIHMRSHQGGFEYSNLDGLVSPAYTVIRAKKNLVDPLYFKYWFRTPQFIHTLASIHTGIREGQSIKWGQFKNLELDLPPLEEQKRISKLLTNCDELLETVKSQKLALEKTKEQLMNNVFNN